MAIGQVYCITATAMKRGGANLNNRVILFDAPMKVSFAEQTLDAALQPGELFVQKLYSLISTGTELACLSGGESWFKMPAMPGYCCVSQVKNSESEKYMAGDIIFHYGSHSQYQKIAEGDFIVKVPDGVDLQCVPMLRMATVAFTAVRISNIELGDWVAVTGQGLVGNMAAQLAKRSGATVVGVDPSATRREESVLCGIDYALPSEGAVDRIRELTGGLGVNTVIEATGVPKVAEEVLPAIGYHGEIILLGTPRGGYMANLAEVLRFCHIDGLGSVTFKGAHEWRYPVKREKFVKHSIERNTEICMRLMRRGELRVKELISHVITPEQAPEIYLKLNADRNEYLGIIIDWTKE